MLATLKHFLQAGWIAVRLRRAGIPHVHAHFASGPAAVALHLHRLTGITYSFTEAEMTPDALKTLYVRAMAADEGARNELLRRLSVVAAKAVLATAPHLKPHDAADVMQNVLLTQAQCGCWVRPANGLRSLERWRGGARGAAGVGRQARALGQA